MTSVDPKITKALAHFENLSTVASTLNAASDELTKVVAALDEALKKLNIGLTVWMSFRYRGDPDSTGEYDTDQIGYAKVQSSWGLALRRIWGNESFDAHNEDGPWHFSDAPREMRIAAVDRIPEFIEALSKEASDTTRRVQEKTKQVRELAVAIGQMASPSKPAKGLGGLKTLQENLAKPTMKLSDLGTKSDQVLRALQTANAPVSPAKPVAKLSDLNPKGNQGGK
jgi:hypothetical protein